MSRTSNARRSERRGLGGVGGWRLGAGVQRIGRNPEEASDRIARLEAGDGDPSLLLKVEKVVKAVGGRARAVPHVAANILIVGIDTVHFGASLGQEVRQDRSRLIGVVPHNVLLPDRLRRAVGG